MLLLIDAADEPVVHPLRQAITFRQIVFFFVTATSVRAIAVIAIAHDESFRIVRNDPAKRYVVGSPHFINSIAQVLRGVVGTIGVGLIRRVGHFDS